MRKKKSTKNVADPNVNNTTTRSYHKVSAEGRIHPIYYLLHYLLRVSIFHDLNKNANRGFKISPLALV